MYEMKRVISTELMLEYIDIPSRTIFGKRMTFLIFLSLNVMRDGQILSEIRSNV